MFIIFILITIGTFLVPNLVLFMFTVHFSFLEISSNNQRKSIPNSNSINDNGRRDEALKSWKHLNRVNLILEEVLSLSGRSFFSSNGGEAEKVRRVIQEMTNTARLEMNAFSSESSFDEWKAKESRKLSFIVQNRIQNLQNPSDEESCKSASKIYCQIRNKDGFASAFHDMIWCFVAGYYRRKMVLLDTSKWKYLKEEKWEQVFMPVSDKNCSMWPNETRELFPGKNGSVERRLLHYLPKEIGKRLTAFHADPLAWWIGQFAVYIFRPQPRLVNFYADLRKKLKLTGDYAAVHVRRTDKIGAEASNHSVDEYMVHVDNYYRRQELISSNGEDDDDGDDGGKRRRVYVASDDPWVIKECQNKYSNYTFISTSDGAKLAEFHRTRYSNSSLWNLLTDLYFLSDANYFVGTFSSGISRLAYELLQGKAVDGTLRARSIDVPFHYDYATNPARVAIYAHSSSDPKREWTLNVGDIIYTHHGGDLMLQAKRGKHYDAYFYGTNYQRKLNKKYPWYKTAAKIPLF